MKLRILMVLLIISSNLFSQDNYNNKLKVELDSVMVLDAKYRLIIEACLSDSTYKDSVVTSLKINSNDFISELFKLQAPLDSMNLIFIEKIIKTYGYPGKKLVGFPSNEVAFYVIQHSNKISIYFPIIKKAALNNDLDKSLAAMMEDRILVDMGKEQIYGTQIQCSLNNKCFVWPIKNPKKVNQRRKTVGFKDTVEENAKRLNTEYKIVKLKEIKQTTFN